MWQFEVFTAAELFLILCDLKNGSRYLLELSIFINLLVGLTFKIVMIC